MMLSDRLSPTRRLQACFVAVGICLIAWRLAAAYSAGQAPLPKARNVAPRHSIALGVRWAAIPAAAFEMGCVPNDPGCDDGERPRHPVTITKRFVLMTTEVTEGMFRAYAIANGQAVPVQPDWNRQGLHPIVAVTWDEARAFCAWIAGRLPTEAEWEHAARGGLADRFYPWGDEGPVCGEEPDIGERFENAARYDDNLSCDSNGLQLGSWPSGSSGRNGYGLQDVAGNVWEWVNDCYAPYPSVPVTDPIGPASCNARVLRGGAWSSLRGYLRVSKRSSLSVDARSFSVGFRCARDAFPLRVTRPTFGHHRVGGAQGLVVVGQDQLEPVGDGGPPDAPAMEAGISDHVWNFEEIVALLDQPSN